MKRLTISELRKFVSENEVLYGHPERPGLMLTPDNRIVKSFYPRKRISTSTFIPQAKRFVANARKLRERNIEAPIVEDVIYCRDIPVHMVVYERIDGVDLRELCKAGHIDCLSSLAAFLAHIHHKGVYFRAVHLGNLLKRSTDGFAILDIADLTTRSGPLGPLQRARNLAHLINTTDDRGFFEEYGIDNFFTEYLGHCDLSDWRRWMLTRRFSMALNEPDPA